MFVDWLIERKAWGAGVDLLCGALWSLGWWGEGPASIARKESLAKRLKGQREQILGPILDAYEASQKTGVPMLNSWKKWVVIIGPAAFYLAEVVIKDAIAGAADQPMSGTRLVALLPLLLPLLMWVKQALGVETLAVKERVLAREAEVKDKEIALRTIERDILVRKLAAPVAGYSGEA